MRLHVVPALGGIRLAKLSPADLQRLYADRLAYGLSPTSVSHLHFVLHRALHQALRWELGQRNVSEMVDPPRRKTPEAKTWDAKQVAAGSRYRRANAACSPVAAGVADRDAPR